MMEQSILTSIKQMLGVESTEEHFDLDIMMHINSALATIEQLGIGKDGTAMMVGDKTTNWLDLFDDNSIVSSAKVFVLLKTRLMFDPPDSSFVTNSMKEQISELTVRMLIQQEEVTAELLALAELAEEET